MLATLSLVLLGLLPGAEDMRVRRDIAYETPKSERQTLDVYAPKSDEKHPIVVWIHGGAWRVGDKKSVQLKPQAFVDQGFVFVSTNYRFVPKVSVAEMTADIAKAIRWARDHADKFGGDPDKIIVAGHSAGAHLAALVCCDGRYLKEEGMSLADISGCIPVDTAAYDIPERVKSSGRVATRLYTGVFGETAEEQKRFSPSTYVSKDKQAPAFLILHVADRVDSTLQSKAFAKRLTKAGVPAKVVAGEGKTHATINRELGSDGDKPTVAVFQFIKEITKSPTQEEG
ncbi:MAG: alpha/beta hydrolase [bacterium]|nr:alpha/beta hydrolase [bacterium]